MTQETLFELDEPPPFQFKVRPACRLCGAVGPVIAEEPMLPKPHLWALVAIAEHMREMHPDQDAPGC